MASFSRTAQAKGALSLLIILALVFASGAAHVCAYCNKNGDRLSCSYNCGSGTRASNIGMQKCTYYAARSTMKNYDGFICPTKIKNFQGPKGVSCVPKIYDCDAIETVPVATTCPSTRSWCPGR
jgi:uncharacterized protein (UPF0333 family)